MQLEGKCNTFAQAKHDAEATAHHWQTQCERTAQLSQDLAAEADGLKSDIADRESQLRALSDNLHSLQAQVRCCSVPILRRSIDTAGIWVQQRLDKLSARLSGGLCHAPQLLQKARREQELQEQVQQRDEEVEAAQARATQVEDRFTAWRQVQAELAHALPQERTRVSAGRLNPELGSSVPKQGMMRFQKGPSSPAAAFEQSAQQKQSPLDIFREVYGQGGRSAGGNSKAVHDSPCSSGKGVHSAPDEDYMNVPANCVPIFCLQSVSSFKQGNVQVYIMPSLLRLVLSVSSAAAMPPCSPVLLYSSFRMHCRCASV